MEAVAVAAVTGLFGLATVLFQRKVHRDNRADHAATAEVVREMRGDVSEIKADVREVKADIRSHGERLRRLEDDPLPQPPRS